METPPRETNQGPNPGPQAQAQPWPPRRATRSALAEIPLRLNMLTVQEPAQTEAEPQRTAPGDMEGTPTVGRWQLNVSVNLPSSYVSPSPSPDELVIQQRGRRRMPVTWSPDVEAAKQQHQRTPVKGGSPAKNNGSGIVLRSTPRKRLMLDSAAGAKDPFTTPEKMRRMSPNSKRGARTERFATPAVSGLLDSVLQALSPAQVASLVLQLLARHPQLEQEVREMLPIPDLRPLEERLSDLRRNIFKSLPSTRLTSKTDSPAYGRAATHLQAFKKCVLEQARQLAGSQNWGALLDYVLLAWGHVRSTPLWDNPPHNACRRTCFKTLAAHCLSALRRGAWTQKQLEALECRLEGMVADSEDVQTCLKHVSALRK